MAATPELQQTVGKTASFSGTALHTGEKVTLKLHPAPVDHGIKFRRKDLQDEPTVDASIENLKTVERATTIGEGPVRVHTVEHVLAALSAMGVDNAVVEMDANEPPIGDGSAQAYVDLVRKAGVTEQQEPRKSSEVLAPGQGPGPGRRKKIVPGPRHQGCPGGRGSQHSTGRDD